MDPNPRKPSQNHPHNSQNFIPRHSNHDPDESPNDKRIKKDIDEVFQSQTSKLQDFTYTLSQLKQALYKKLHTFLKPYDFKTEFCIHKAGCLENSIQGFLKNFTIGFLIKLTFLFLKAILKNKHKLPALLLHKIRIFIQNPSFSFKNVKSVFRLGLFLGLFGFVFKIVLCLMRVVRKREDGVNAFVAGCVGGVSILVEESGFRKNLHLYLLSRAVECGFRMLKQRMWFRGFVMDEIVAFAGISAFLMYIFAYAFYAFPPKLESFFNKFSHLKCYDFDYLQALRRIAARSLQLRLSGFSSIL